MTQRMQRSILTVRYSPVGSFSPLGFACFIKVYIIKSNPAIPVILIRSSADFTGSKEPMWGTAISPSLTA
jgi:hypothetical protein